MTGLFEHIPVDDAVPFGEIVSQWNEMATTAGLETVRKLTPKRKAKLAKRWSEPMFRDNWQRMLQIIPRIPWMCGVNKRRWRITLNFLIRSEDTYVRILEQGDRLDQGRRQTSSTDDARSGDAAAVRGE